MGIEKHALKTAQTRIEQHITLLNTANKKYQSPSLADDIITLKKFLSLAKNLGRIKSISDQPLASGADVYFMHTLNQFGRARNGYHRMNSGSPQALENVENRWRKRLEERN